MFVLYEATIQSCCHYAERSLETQVGVIKYHFLLFFCLFPTKFLFGMKNQNSLNKINCCLPVIKTENLQSMWKSYQEVPLYKEKEELILCEEEFVNKNGIHQSMETNIKKLCMHQKMQKRVVQYLFKSLASTMNSQQMYLAFS